MAWKILFNTFDSCDCSDQIHICTLGKIYTQLSKLLALLASVRKLNFYAR